MDSLTPIVANLHPLTVINHLHTSCVGQVEAANILKTTENIAKLCQTPTGEDGPLSEGIYEETVKTQLQAAIFLPKVLNSKILNLQKIFKKILILGQRNASPSLNR